MKKFVIKRKWYSKHFSGFLKTKKRYCVLMGGRGSSKTHHVMLKLFSETFIQGHFLGVYCRHEYETLRKTTFPDLCGFLEKTGLSEYFNYSKSSNSSMSFTNKITGNKLIPFGLDDPEKTKGIPDATTIWIDEADKCTYEQFAMINSVLRTPNAKYLQMILSYNPTSSKSYIAKTFFKESNLYEIDDRFKEETYFNRSTVHHNEYINIEDYVKNLRLVYGGNPQALAVNLHGEWGEVDNTIPWFYNFKKEKHVTSGLRYNPQLTTYLSVDFNVNPLCAIVAQGGINDNSYCHVVKNYRIENADLEDLASRVSKDFPFYTKMMLIADASGYARDVGMPKNEWNKIEKLKRLLKLTDYQLRLIPKKNPSYSNSRELCNTVLEHHNDFKIDNSCVELINDIIVSKVDEKSKDQDALFKDNTETFNMNLTDCFRYLINSLYPDFISKYIYKK